MARHQMPSHDRVPEPVLSSCKCLDARKRGSGEAGYRRDNPQPLRGGGDASKHSGENGENADGKVEVVVSMRPLVREGAVVASLLDDALDGLTRASAD
jgi:hypothetical protein